MQLSVPHLLQAQYLEVSSAKRFMSRTKRNESLHCSFKSVTNANNHSNCFMVAICECLLQWETVLEPVSIRVAQLTSNQNFGITSTFQVWTAGLSHGFVIQMLTVLTQECRFIREPVRLSTTANALPVL